MLTHAPTVLIIAKSIRKRPLFGDFDSRLSIFLFWPDIERSKVDKFIKKEIESANDTTEKNALETEQSVVRGGQLFTDQFYSQHMRFHKDVSFRLFIREHANKYVMFFRMNQIPTQKTDLELGSVNGKRPIRKVSMAKQKKLAAFMVMILHKQR